MVGPGSWCLLLDVLGVYFQSSVTGCVSSRKGKVAVLKKIYCCRILHSKKSHP